MHSRGTLRDPPLPIPSCCWVAGVCCSHFLFSNLSCYFARTSSLREQLASHWWCYHTISKLCAQPMLCGAPARVSRRDLRRTEKKRREKNRLCYSKNRKSLFASLPKKPACFRVIQENVFELAQPLETLRRNVPFYEPQITLCIIAEKTCVLPSHTGKCF